MAPKASDVKKIRILCLHGHAQTAAVFRAKTGSLRNVLKKSEVEYHYLDGPFHVPPCEHSAEAAKSWMRTDPATARPVSDWT